MSIQRWLNWPNRAESTLSPRASVLHSADSQMPVPLAGNRKIVPSLEPNTRLASWNSGFVSAGKSTER